MAPPTTAGSDEEEQVTTAWGAIHHALDTHVLSSTTPQSDQSDLAARLRAALPAAAFKCLGDAGLGGLVLEYAVEGLDAELRREVAPRFWAHFATSPDAGVDAGQQVSVCVWLFVCVYGCGGQSIGQSIPPISQIHTHHPIQNDK